MSKPVDNREVSHVDINKKLISYTRFSSFMNCPYKYHLKYKRKVRPNKDSVKFSFGRAMHEALAYYYGMGAKPMDVLEYYDSVWKEAVKNESIDFGKKKVTKAMAKEDDSLEYGSFVPIRPEYYRQMGLEMLDSYFKVYEKEDFEVEAVEVSFTAPFKNPKSNYTNRKWATTGIIDLIIKRPDGFYEIWDHKCMGKTVSDATMTLSHQVSNYYLGAVDILGVPVTKIKKAVFNILYKMAGYPCARIETTRNEKQLDIFLNQLNRSCKAIDNDLIFQNISFSCSSCDYYKFCQGKDEDYIEENNEIVDDDIDNLDNVN